MKKLILGLAISTLFTVSAAQAEVNPNDVGAILTVSGTVTAPQNCAVNLNQSSVELNGDVASLIAQGIPNTGDTTGVYMTISGDEQCNASVADGKMAFQFLGTADDSMGNSLANSSTAANAATGVGIAIYDEAGNVLAINKDHMVAKSTGSSRLGLGLVKLNGATATAGTVQGSLTIQIERL